MATATNSKPRKPSDVCRLVVMIRGESYTCRPIPTAPGLAWRLRKADGTAYNVTARECDCPDHVYRHSGQDDAGCKHQRALRALGLLPPADAVTEDDPTDPDNGPAEHWPEWTDGHRYAVTR